jgi:3-deoxy-7-phosphoheptulonate synthase
MPGMKTRDLRIQNIRPLIPPAILLEEHPLTDEGSVTVSRFRDEVIRILNQEDDRLITVVGPCSIHDPVAALEYAHRLRGIRDELQDDLCILMRVYFEKPRTTVGWKGLLNDPHLDESYQANDGLRMGRRFLLDVLDVGLGAACEFLDPITPQFISDVITWAAIGARTTESQVHREMVSGLSMPVGFKSGTSGDVQIAIDAVRASAHSHRFFGVTEQGLAAIIATNGNKDCHIVLRGGRQGPNSDAVSVQEALTSLERAGVPPRVMIDASHDNSLKDHLRQPLVAHEIGEQVAQGQTGIIGVMLESFLVDGRQNLVDPSTLVYGQSITDACMSWDRTVPVLHELAEAVRSRRVHAGGGKPMAASQSSSR